MSNVNYHVGAMFLDCMKRKPPEGIFQIDAATGDEETNESVMSRTVRLAKCFRKIGLEPGDVLALGGYHHLDLHIPYYAAMINGYTLVGVDPYYKYAELRNLFKLTAPKIAFCQQASAELYAQAAADLGLDVKIVTFDGDYTLTKFMEENDDHENKEELKAAEFDANSIYAWLVSTSGTTGMPKVAAITHQTIVARTMSSMNFRNVSTDRPRVAFCLSPVHTMGGFYIAVHLPINKHVQLQTTRPDDIGHIIDTINKYKPVCLMLNPPILSLILKHEKQCNLRCFDTLIVTGSKAPKELILEAQARLKPGVLQEMYGLTEAVGPLLVPNPAGPVGNCGMPMPSAIREIKLVDPDTGDEVTEPLVHGELWTRGPSFTEFYNSPEQTAKAFTEDGWYKTGDILYRDASNNYFFVNRIKMLIKYMNYHVNPCELEEVIMQLEGILEVAVVGIPHPTDSQQVVACVVLRPGCVVSAQQIKDIVASTLAPSKQLHGGVVFMDALPMTSTGKVARAQLTKLVATLKRE